MKATRQNITQPTDWWDAFKRQAKAEGMTLSEWMGQCARSQLPASKRLSERVPKGRPASKTK